METLRTPDERFENLSGYSYSPNYVTIDDQDGGELRVHYLDEGPSDAAPVLLMHGEPSWSYLYRHMIDPLVSAGHRVIAPDLVGFGRSDKPTEQDDYTYDRHIAWLTDVLFGHLDLTNITLFCQDWGGLIGLRLVTSEPDRFARVAVANTGLPTGHGTPPKAFLAWQNFSKTSPVFPIGDIIDGGTTTPLADDVKAGYNAPFPDDSYMAGARIFPSLVPTSEDQPGAADNREAWKTLVDFDRPFLCLFSDEDAVTKGGEKPFLERVAGAQDQPHKTIEGGGHFLQEDRGAEIAAELNAWIAAT